MPITPNDLVEVGHIMDAQGVRGQIKVRPYSNDPEALLDAEKVWLINSDLSKNSSIKEPQYFEVVSARYHSGNIVMHLGTIEDRDQALALKGSVILMSRADFPELDEDTFYWSDLIGLEVKNQQHEVLGVVQEVLENGAQSILSVMDDAKKQHLIPFKSPIIDTVHLPKNQESGLIIVDWQKDW